MNNTILRQIAFFDRAYATCIRFLQKAKSEEDKEKRRNDSLHWLQERVNFLSRAKDTLTDDEYLKLTIY